MPPLHLAFCCDRTYLQPLVVAMQSVLETARHPSAAHFWIVSEAVDRSAAATVERVAGAFGATVTFLHTGGANVRLQHVPVRGHISIAAYYRLFLPEVLPPEVGKVVYLDSDVLVRRPIEDLAATELNGAPLAAVMKPRAAEFKDVGLAAEKDYFNSGVLVIDTARWRDEGIRATALEYAYRHPDGRHGHDQPALNHALRGRWKRLALRWNQQFKFFVHTAGYLRLTRERLRRVRSDPFIIHYTTGSKPWHFANDHPWRSAYYDVLDRTPFAGWRPSPQPGGGRHWLAAMTPHYLRPAVLRNVYRPYYQMWKTRWRAAAQSLYPRAS